MKIITSKDNDKIKHCKKLSSKSYRDENNEFLLEGIKLINQAVSYNVKIKAIFVDDKFICENKKLIETLNNRCDLFKVTDIILKKISDLKTPQGIIAIAEKPVYNGKTFDKYIALDNLQDVGNIGTIIRTAFAFNMGVIVSSDCADLFSIKTIRASMGASMSSNIIITKDLEKSLCQFKDNGYKVYGGALLNESKSLKEIKFSDKTIIVTGNEGNGISEKILDVCDEKVIIPINSEIQSLNAAIASGIFMYIING